MAFRVGGSKIWGTLGMGSQAKSSEFPVAAPGYHPVASLSFFQGARLSGERLTKFSGRHIGPPFGSTRAF
jgi:hypothetical protein